MLVCCILVFVCDFAAVMANKDTHKTYMWIIMWTGKIMQLQNTLVDVFL